MCKGSNLVRVRLKNVSMSVSDLIQLKREYQNHENGGEMLPKKIKMGLEQKKKALKTLKIRKNNLPFIARNR